MRITILWVCILLVSGLTGCLSKAQRPPLSEHPELQRKLSSPSSLQLVKDLARPWGLKWIEVEGVSLTVGLNGTGSDPAPSEDYKMLISEMQVRDVDQPEAILASQSTALTLVRALIPPGAQKGDRIDVEVRVPAKSKTSDLNGGWLMLTRLKEFARVNGRLSSGHVMAMAQGNILVDSLIEGADDPVLKTRGRILGGGVVTRSRELGLRVRDENMTVRTSAQVGEMINRRFHIYDHGDKKGVANPKKDSFISLVVHPRYRDNLVRYIRVIENIPVRESSAGLVERLQDLSIKLIDPDTASHAAVQLEAIGEDAIPVLMNGLSSDNSEVRFFAAEALAYMNVPAAAPVLSESIRVEPAFRWRGFHAMGALDDVAVLDALAGLMREESAETRYGAFRAMLKLAPDDPLVRGRTMGDEFRLHSVVASSCKMVHISKSEVPEIVVFGRDVALHPPLVAFAGKEIVVRSTEDGRILVRRLTDSDDGDRQLVVDADLPSVIGAVVDLGGKYADVVEVLAEARAKGSLNCRLDYGAIARPNRKLKRGSGSAAEVAGLDGDIDDPTNGVARLNRIMESESRRPMPADNLVPVFDGDFADDEVQASRVAGVSSVSIRGEDSIPIEVVIDDDDELAGEILFDDSSPVVGDPVSFDMAPPATVIDVIRP